MTPTHPTTPARSGPQRDAEPPTGREPAESDGRLVERAPLNGNRHTRSTPDGVGERVDLPITGMTCAACAQRIEKNLAATPGVRRAAVNLATSRATVEYEPERTGVRQLMDAVKATGYGTSGTARADFVVDDSARPAGSARPLEQHLERLTGVVQPSFNLAARQVRVEYLPGAIDVAAIRRAIEDLGYDVHDVAGAGGDEAAADSEEVARAAEYRELKRKFWTAALLSVPVLAVAILHRRVGLLDAPWVNWMQLAFTTPVVFYSGAQFYRGAWAAFRHRAADMNTLIAIGTGVAYVYSVAATVAPRLIVGRGAR